MHISKLAARLTAGLRAAAASSAHRDQSVLTPSAAQHTAVGPQAAPDPQDAPLLSGSLQLLPPRSAAGPDKYLTSAGAAAAVMITPFAQGACSYASAMLDAIDTWVGKHQPEARWKPCIPICRACKMQLHNIHVLMSYISPSERSPVFARLSTKS